MTDLDKLQLFDLEIDLWERCNLSCAQCTHSSPHFDSTDPIYDFEQFKNDITNLNKIATIDTFRIVGGEPLLNKNLIQYVKFLKESNIAKYITIFTNGLVLSHTNNDVFPYIDRLRISVYPNIGETKTNLIYSNIKKIKDLHPHLNVVDNKINQFSYFNLASKTNDENVVKKIYENCYYSYEHRGFSIFNGRFYKCFASRKKYKFLQKHSKENNFDHLKSNLHDSIELNNLQKLDLENFINTKTPLEGCKWCLGTCGSQLNHTQIKNSTEEPATLEHLDYSKGEQYMSNLLLSWSLKDPQLKIIDNNKFFNIKHLKHYTERFKR